MAATLRHQTASRAVAILLSLAMVAAAGCSTVKNSDELEPKEIAALEESQSRIVAYRKAIQAIRDGSNPTPRTPAESAAAKRQLRVLISKETELQGAIIHKDPKVHIIAADVLKGAGEALVFPLVVGYVALAAFMGDGGKASGTISVK